MQDQGANNDLIQPQQPVEPVQPTGPIVNPNEQQPVGPVQAQQEPVAPAQQPMAEALPPQTMQTPITEPRQDPSGGPEAPVEPQSPQPLEQPVVEEEPYVQNQEDQPAESPEVSEGPPGSQPPKVDGVDPVVQASQAPVQQLPEDHKPNKTKLLLVGVLLFCVVLGLAVIGGKALVGNSVQDDTTKSESVKEDFAEFTDPKFKINLPKSWSGDAGYKPGKNLVLFYSGEAKIDQDRAKAAYMTMFINIGSNKRIDDQVKHMDKSGVSYRILQDREFMFGDSKGRIFEITASQKEQPDKVTHTLTADIESGGKYYSIDIVADDEFWVLHNANATKIIESFRPL